MISVVINNQMFTFNNDDDLIESLEENADEVEDTSMDDGVYYGDED